MPNTILEKLQEQYPGAPGIKDARNIAEAVACISSSGGRGAGAIADHLGELESVPYKRSGATGNDIYIKRLAGAQINLYNDPCTIFNWTAPEGKIFAGWSARPNETTPLTDPVYMKDLPLQALYAIWKDAE